MILVCLTDRCGTAQRFIENTVPVPVAVCLVACQDSPIDRHFQHTLVVNTPAPPFRAAGRIVSDETSENVGFQSGV
ncbi:hypothetical protein Barb7_01626 [Bacteroidales bacterium Barb7]|nr:hypothetical protein Barb7_01626 [Bacteroidales bacterium Barb7]